MLGTSSNCTLDLTMFRHRRPQKCVRVVRKVRRRGRHCRTFTRRLQRTKFAIIASSVQKRKRRTPGLKFFGRGSNSHCLLSSRMRVATCVERQFRARGIVVFTRSVKAVVTEGLLYARSRDCTGIMLDKFPGCPKARVVHVKFFLAGLLAETHKPVCRSGLIRRLSIKGFGGRVGRTGARIS